MLNLPEIDFVNFSAEQEELSMLKKYKALTGRSLKVGDPIRLFIKYITAYILELKNLINETGKQNLLKYARSGNLDNLGAFWGIQRIPAQNAKTTLRYELSVVRDRDTIIKKGSRVSNGLLYFATDNELIINAGSISDTVTATCLSTGSNGNGYLPGELNQIVDVQSYVAKCENITITNGGSEEETDSELRERIFEAPEGLSVAGPIGLYQRFTKSINPLIVDVFVDSPSPGIVRVIPLLNNGQIPSTELLHEIESFLMQEDIRPLTDLVKVNPPSIKYYSLTLTFWMNEGYLRDEVDVQVDEVVDKFKLWTMSKLGRDINDSELIRRLKTIAGVKRVHLLMPYEVVNDDEIAILSDRLIHNEGFEKE